MFTLGSLKIMSVSEDPLEEEDEPPMAKVRGRLEHALPTMLALIPMLFISKIKYAF